MTQTTYYSPVLAKIGVERSKLVPADKLNQLAESKNLTDFVRQFGATRYGEILGKLLLPLSSHKLEAAFKEILIETYSKIIGSSPKCVATFLQLNMLKFELENIKTLLKATYARLTTAQKLNRIHLSAENFLKNQTLFSEALKATDLKKLVNTLVNTEFAEALTLGLESYEESASTACFDVLLDKAYYERLYSAFDSLPKKEKAHASYYASMENDGFTLLTLLRGKNLKYSKDWLRLAVPRSNFNLPKETVEALVMASDFDSAFEIVSQTYYRGLFAKEQDPHETLSKAERAFKKAVFENARRSRILEIFNIGAPLAFMIQADAEVHNLIALSIGVESRTRPKDTRSQLLA